MTASVGATTGTDFRNSGEVRPIWEKVVVFPIISGDTTGAATVPINGLLQKIIVTITDFTGGDGTVDVTLTDNGNNTIFTVSDLADPATHVYSVSEPFANEINIALAFDDPVAAETITVTLRGI